MNTEIVILYGLRDTKTGQLLVMGLEEETRLGDEDFLEYFLNLHPERPWLVPSLERVQKIYSDIKDNYCRCTEDFPGSCVPHEQLEIVKLEGMLTTFIGEKK